MNDFLRKLRGWVLLGMAIGGLWIVVKRLVEISQPAPAAAEPEPEIPVPPSAETADPLAAVAQGLLAAGLVAPPAKQTGRAAAAPQALSKPAPKRQTRPAKASVPPDDLSRLWGIGPKITGLLNQAGIVSYAQLAQADPARLQEILLAGGARLAKPESWPEQARLAAAGRWDELQALVQKLKTAA